MNETIPEDVKIHKEFTSATGKLVTIEGTLQLSKINYSDGLNIQVPACEIVIFVKVDGRSFSDWARRLSGAQIKHLENQGLTGYTHYIEGSARNLVLTNEQTAMLKSVKSELQQRPEWQAKQAAIKKNEDDYQAMMEKRNAHSGWCNRCESYCYSDCQA